jgi:hypothetical protein
MRSLSILSVVVVISGCGGNWSNADLAFANALPRRDELKSKLPTASTSQPLEGTSTRRDGLMVGDASGAWAQTRKAAADYNGMIDQLLGLVDQVRRVAPSTRAENTRIWGPYADSNNPGREVQLRITRVDELNFEWSIESRAVGQEFIQIITGNFRATETARRGVGTMVVHVKEFRDVVKVDSNLQQLDQIDVGYVTDMFPKRVEMLFMVKPGSTLALSSLGYTSREQEDGSGSMRFVYARTDPQVEELEITSVWKPTGEGRALGVVRKGTFTGANVTECWGKDFKVVHYAESWITGERSGNEADCVVIEGF